MLKAVATSNKAMISAAVVFRPDEMPIQPLITDIGQPIRILSSWPGTNYVRQAMFCGIVPTNFDISIVPGEYKGSILDISQLTAAQPKVHVTFGETVDVELVDLLDKPTIWYAGSDAIEAHYRHQVFNGAICTHQVDFHVRYFAGGNIFVRVLFARPWFRRWEIKYLESAELTVTINGQEQRQQVDSYPNATIPVEGWIGEPSIYGLQHDAKRFIDAGIFAEYGRAKVSEAVLAGMVKEYKIGSIANQREAMGGTGYHGSIGIVPTWVVAWLASGGDHRALTAMQVNDKAVLQHALTWRTATGEIMTPAANPKGSILSNGGGATDISNGILRTDIAHKPMVGLSWWATGEKFYLDAMEGSCATTYQFQWNRDGEGTNRIVKYAAQTRGTAWGMYRDVSVLCAAMPDDSPSLPIWREWLHNNVKFALAKLDEAGEPNIGLPFYRQVEKTLVTALSPWQIDFWVGSMAMGTQQKPLMPDQQKDYDRLLHTMGKNGVVNRIEACGTHASPYTITITTPATRYEVFAKDFFKTWGEVYVANWAQAADDIASGCPHTIGKSLNQGYGVTSAPTTYWGGLGATLELLKHVGVDGAADALNWIYTADNYDQYKNANWSYVPQTIMYTGEPLPDPIPEPIPDPLPEPEPDPMPDPADVKEWRAALPVNTFVEVPDTNFYTTVQALNPELMKYPGSNPVAALADCYGDPAISVCGRYYWYFSGGHAAGYAPSIIEYDTLTHKISELFRAPPLATTPPIFRNSGNQPPLKYPSWKPLGEEFPDMAEYVVDGCHPTVPYDWRAYRKCAPGYLSADVEDPLDLPYKSPYNAYLPGHWYQTATTKINKENGHEEIWYFYGYWSVAFDVTDRKWVVLPGDSEPQGQQLNRINPKYGPSRLAEYVGALPNPYTDRMWVALTYGSCGVYNRQAFAVYNTYDKAFERAIWAPTWSACTYLAAPTNGSHTPDHAYIISSPHGESSKNAYMKYFQASYGYRVSMQTEKAEWLRFEGGLDKPRWGAGTESVHANYNPAINAIMMRDVLDEPMVMYLVLLDEPPLRGTGTKADPVVLNVHKITMSGATPKSQFNYRRFTTGADGVTEFLPQARGNHFAFKLDISAIDVEPLPVPDPDPIPDPVPDPTPDPDPTPYPYPDPTPDPDPLPDPEPTPDPVPEPCGDMSISITAPSMYFINPDGTVIDLPSSRSLHEAMEKASKFDAGEYILVRPNCTIKVTK